jgi:hypothetical protein
MSKIGRCAAVLAISTAAAVVISSGSPALADPPPLIDIIDNIVPNASILPNLQPSLNTSPSVLCIPSARNNNSIKGENNQASNNQTNNCTQSAQQTSPPPPPNGGLSGYAVYGDNDTCAPGETCTVTITCPEGQRVIEGGYTIGGNDETFADQAEQEFDGASYTVSARNRDDNGIGVAARVSCADVAP